MSGRRLFASISAGLLTVALLGACGNSDESSANSSDRESAAAGASFPVTVEHVHGTTPVKSEPKRVVSLASADQDTALALGVVPVGAAKQTVGGTPAGSTPWFDAELKKVGGATPTWLDLDQDIDVDAIKQLDPDLILSTGRTLSDADYEALSAVAPVVAGDEDGQSWQNSLEAAGAALGKSEEADAVEDRTDKVIKEGAGDQQGLADTTFILAHINPSRYDSIGIHTTRDPRVSLLRDFGLVVPEVVEELGSDKDLVQVDADRAESLKSEIMLLLPGAPKEVVALESNPRLSRIPALDDGRAYAELNKTLHLALAQPSPLNIPRVIEKYLPDVALIADF